MDVDARLDNLCFFNTMCVGTCVKMVKFQFILITIYCIHIATYQYLCRIYLYEGPHSGCVNRNRKVQSPEGRGKLAAGIPSDECKKT